MGKPTEPVLLDRHWDVGALLGQTFKLFWRHAGLFLALTAIIAVPYVLATSLLWGEDLKEFDAENLPPWQAFVIPGILGATVIPALITAVHVVSVRRLSEGERPSVGEAFSLAADRAGPAILTGLLYVVVVALGFLLLIVPGVFLAVRLYLGVQIAVVERVGPVEALTRSSELVKGRWWPTFGRLLLAGIVFAIVTAPLSVPAELVDYGTVWVVLSCLQQLIELSLTALFGTLVFFDYKLPAREKPAAYGGFEPPQAPPAG
jgi:hypothetical protein